MFFILGGRKTAAALYMLHILTPQVSYCFDAIHTVCIFVLQQQVFSQTEVTCKPIGDSTNIRRHSNNFNFSKDYSSALTHPLLRGLIFLPTHKEDSKANTHLQAAQGRHTDPSLQKSQVLLSHRSNFRQQKLVCCQLFD